MLQKLIAPIVDRILAKLEVERRLDELCDEALEMLAAQIPVLMDKLLALLPMLSATVAKTVAEQVTAQFSKVLDADPDIPVVSDVVDLSEIVRKSLNDNTPDGIHIPVLSDILGGFLKGR